MSGKRYWYQKQLRMLQTVLREPDIVNYDAKSVVAYMKKTYTNCIVVNAGGIVDFFENQSLMGRKNAFMTCENILGDLVSECHANGIHVMARVDFRGVERTRYEKNPDWFAMEADGSPKTGWGEADLRKPCYNSIYANEHAVDYINRMMTKYDLDGIWENCVGFGDGPCYCQRCRNLYRKDVGEEIPTGIPYTSAEFDRYRSWKAECADRHLVRMRKAVKAFGNDKAYCAEIFGMFHASNAMNTGIDLYGAARHFDFLVSPAFLDGSANAEKKWDNLSYAASSMKFLKALNNKSQCVLLYGNNGTKWRYVKAPSVETKLWMWNAASVGAGFWNCMFNGQHPNQTFDRRNQGIETEVYQYLEANEELLDGQTPKAEAGIFYSKCSRDALGNDSEEDDQYGVYVKGVERVLTENHIPYNFVPDLGFCDQSLKDIKVLILPNTAYMSDEHIEVIREYVKNGGGLVASYETSRYDENGRIRSDFGMADLFGVRDTGIRKDTSADCYQKIVRLHPLLEHMNAEQTDVIMNEGNTLLCRAAEGKEGGVICTYVPKISNQPPELAWIPAMDTEFPSIMTNEYGKGRVVYFANQTDKLCYTNGHEDFMDTFYNAVNWVKKEEFTLKVNAPASVQVAMTEKNDNPFKKVISFVNTTGAGGRPFRMICPIYDVEAWITLNEEETLKESMVLKGEGVKVDEVKVEKKRMVRIKIDKLTEFTAVGINTKR